ncbi:hypothetical protein DRO02_06445 [archaeon]|nr:MAG: hypothetical protein DRO02_06445 [archaeon]
MEGSALTSIEKELMLGGGRWIAEFNESFRDFRVRDVKFHLYVRGKLRGKGLFISRIISYLFTPDYLLGCFVYEAGENVKVSRKQLSRMMEAMSERMRKDELRFSWLIVLQDKVHEPLKNFVRRISRPDIGILLYERTSGELVHDRNLGIVMAKRVMNKLIKKWRRRGK